MFGVRERRNEVKGKTLKAKSGQNISNKDKTVLRKLVRVKNTLIITNDTDKNTGAADAYKEDVISECVRQLGGIKTYFKLLEG